MSGRPHRRGLAGLALALALPAAAAAQAGDQPYPYAGPRAFSAGGEVSATIGPRDSDAFFNYTDYETNTLRLARLRVFGEWRPVARLAAVGELRVENAARVEAAAAYVRWHPWPGRDLIVQAGRIPPVVGVYSRHAYGRNNLVMGMPLAYQYLTSLRPDALPATLDDVLRMRGRGWRPSFPIGSREVAPGIPLVSAARWDTGVQAIWRYRRMETSGAVTRGAPSVPMVRDRSDGQQWSGRAAVRLPDGLTLGVSGARGAWIDRDVLQLLPPSDAADRVQTLVGVDLEYGYERLLVRAEWFRSTFHLPLLATPGRDTVLAAWSGFVEARYRLHPRWQVAARIERLSFNSIVGSTSATAVAWDAPVDRVEAVVGFRATHRLEFRGGWQHNWRSGGRIQERGIPAVQALFWF